MKNRNQGPIDECCCTFIMISRSFSVAVQVAGREHEMSQRTEKIRRDRRSCLKKKDQRSECHCTSIACITSLLSGPCSQKGQEENVTIAKKPKTEERDERGSNIV